MPCCSGFGKKASDVLKAIFSTPTPPTRNRQQQRRYSRRGNFAQPSGSQINTRYSERKAKLFAVSQERLADNLPSVRKKPRRTSMEIYYKPTGRRRFLRYIDEVPDVEEDASQTVVKIAETDDKNLPPPVFLSRGDKVDIIIFAASGALGSYTVLQAVTVLDSFKWGIAGRNRRHLEMVLRNVSAITGKRVNNIPIFIVDASDKKSLLAMAQECRREDYTFNLMEACIAARTNYVDACIESHIVSTARVKFHDDAKSERIYIVTSCGFFSFVVDMGINYIDGRFNGTVTAVESYIQFQKLDKRMFVPIMSCGVFRSLFATFTFPTSYMNSGNDTTTRGSIVNQCAQALPNIGGYRSPISRTDAVNGISIPMPFVNTQVVQYSQEHFSATEQKHPIVFSNYLTFASYVMAIFALLWCIILYVLAQAPGTRDLLYTFPRIFSLGMCTSDCIEKRSLDNLIFSVTFRAAGVPSKSQKSISKNMALNPHCNSLKSNQSQIMKVRICGRNPFYGFGCVALLSSAIIILSDRSNMPENGGVYTPGAAFRNTDILYEVKRHNSRFKYRTIN